MLYSYTRSFIYSLRHIVRGDRYRGNVQYTVNRALYQCKTTACTSIHNNIFENTSTLHHTGHLVLAIHAGTFRSLAWHAARSKACCIFCVSLWREHGYGGEAAVQSAPATVDRPRGKRNDINSSLDARQKEYRRGGDETVPLQSTHCAAGAHNKTGRIVAHLQTHRPPSAQTTVVAPQSTFRGHTNKQCYGTAPLPSTHHGHHTKNETGNLSNRRHTVGGHNKRERRGTVHPTPAIVGMN